MAIALMTAVTVTGCAWASVQGGSHSSGQGSATGTVEIFGGPINPTTGRMAADGTPAQSVTVSATSSDGHIVTVTTAADGKFSFTLQPGRYSIGARCGPPSPATVAAGRQTTLTLRCDVP